MEKKEELVTIGNLFVGKIKILGEKKANLKIGLTKNGVIVDSHVTVTTLFVKPKVYTL